MGFADFDRPFKNGQGLALGIRVQLHDLYGIQLSEGNKCSKFHGSSVTVVCHALCNVPLQLPISSDDVVATEKSNLSTTNVVLIITAPAPLFQLA